MRNTSKNVSKQVAPKVAKQLSVADGRYVTNAKELKECCELLEGATAIAMDTEFSRVGSYYPLLSLIQVANDRIAFAVDVLAVSAEELTPLFAVLQDPKCCKVFHAGRQDLEALYHNFGVVVENVFDTQIALQFCGFKEPPGYEAMVRHYLHHNITKELQFSDWLQRPLTAEQLNYAIADVVHMHQIHPIIERELRNNEKLKWAYEECAGLPAMVTKPVDVLDLLRKMHSSNQDAKIVARIWRLLVWREQQALRLNISRALILSDEAIVKLANKPSFSPSDHATYKKLTGRYKIPRNHLDAVIKTIPNLVAPVTEEENKIANSLCGEERSLVKNDLFHLLSALLVSTAATHGVSEKLIANQQDLLRLVYGKASKLDSGWRYELFGKTAAALRDGKQSITWDNGAIRMLSSSS